MNPSQSPQPFIPSWIKTVFLLLLLFFLFTAASTPLCMMGAHWTTNPKSAAQGQQIYFAMKMYAGDYDGKFPELNGPSTSNEAFEALLKGGYLSTKAPFFDPYSPFTPAPLPKNDPDPTELAAGQNAFAYIPNLTDTDSPGLPLLATAFKERHIGTYDAPAKQVPAWSENPSFFSRWKKPEPREIYPVIIRLDGSAKSQRPTQAPDGSYRIYGPTTDQKKEADIFEPAEGWLKENQRPVNPASHPKRG